MAAKKQKNFMNLFKYRWRRKAHKIYPMVINPQHRLTVLHWPCCLHLRELGVFRPPPSSAFSSRLGTAKYLHACQPFSRTRFFRSHSAAMANESRPRSSLPSESLPTTKDNTPSIASPHETFQYTPLDLDASVPTFRVLIVHPKSSNRDDGTICCSLKHTSFGELGDIPSYEALSYMWGDESTLSHMNIEVNGHPFTVGKNLGSALARLQSMVDRTIWIDAICINQKDVVEKSSQIPNMPYIYKRCQKCVIWLGEIDPEIETSELEFHPWNEIYEPKCLDENGWGKGRILLDRDVALWKHLTSNPYWERVWIIQEIGLARKLEMMYGPYQTSFSAFTSQLKWVEGLENCIPLRLQTQRDNR